MIYTVLALSVTFGDSSPKGINLQGPSGISPLDR